MNKRTAKLLSLLGIFILLLGGYGIISSFVSQEDSEDTTASTMTVAAIEAEEVDQLRWTYDEETISLSRQDDTWVNTEDDTMPIDQDKVSTMLSALSSIVSNRKLDTPEDLSIYGLDTATCEITVTEQDGTEISFSIGDYNSVSGCYYLMYNDTIYLVDETLLSAYSVTTQDLIAYEELPDLSDTQSMTITSGDNTLTLIHCTENMEEFTYTDSYTWFLEEDDNYTPLSTSAVSSLKSTIAEMEFLSCIAWNADAEVLEETGLSNPAATVTVQYTETDSETETETSHTLTILLGNYVDESCYVMLEDSDLIYTVDASVADTLLLLQASSLLPNDICLVTEDSVDTLVITIDGETSEINMTHETETAEDGTSGVTTTSYFDNVELDPESVQSAFDMLNSMSAQGTADSTVSQRDTVLELTFYRNTDTFQELTLTFSTYDSASYLVTFQGKSRLLADKSDVRSLMDLLESALVSEAAGSSVEGST